MKDGEGRHRNKSLQCASSISYLAWLSTFKKNGNCHDSMEGNNGMKFTTRDRDNDIAKINCANTRTGAWWYFHCTYSNLNGNYSITNGLKGVLWKDYPSSDYMKETTMKMKCG
ncbi:hypothetical protein FSP39_011880 [Pinctada imbricata]|uniref:Fibrinogen C-terminal domain-containing protein n=1 Tax=Pinctada imbricata TaxID=66713 RepID=A0AA89BZK6_PINIB|nr:hypothetical protein FSP39_011880 [Pinctada imbricata]